MSARPAPDATSEPGPAAPRAKGLLTVDAALGLLLDGVRGAPATETVSTFDARGRVLAAALRSRLDVPSMDNAQMDGYAVRACELEAARPGAPIAFPVSQRIPAGHPGTPLAAGTVARIFTGAAMPTGADAVVMQEAVEVDPRSGSVRFAEAVGAGEWVRYRGEDIAAGQVVIAAGTRLLPQHLGLAASIGTAEVVVARRPRVAVFSTGDELAMPGEVAVEDLVPGSLFNSNRFTMRGLVEAMGCEIVDFGIVPDTLDATRRVLVDAAAASDCIVTSGGVSVGEEDHIRPAVDAEGVIDFWQIGIKPGKPLAFGRIRDALFVGLPGNPVSGFVTFLVFVRPLLMRMQGIVDVTPASYALRADFDWPKPDRRQEYLRARCNGDGGLDLFPKQGSAVLTSTAWADGLVENPPGHRIAKGDRVRFLPFAALLA